MKILAVGGGSGGHVTPVVAVLRALKARDPSIELHFWCDYKFAPQARSIMHHFDPSIEVQTIISGKLRRYHNLPVWRQLLRPVSIVFPNLRDMLLVGCGFVQSVGKLLAWRPDVVFTKGGFVCLPVGIAARLLGIPLVIHDSDAHPGLTNRILARIASAIATGAPLKHYPYPLAISRYVGIPIAAEFHPYTIKEQSQAKNELGVDPTRPLIVVTGGGLGARRINDAVALILPKLIKLGTVILVSGATQYDELRALTPETGIDFQLHAFISSGMAAMLGAADVVVTRAGATTIVELAALAKPTILIPNGYLTGGHQLKNAAAYAENGAVVVIDEHVLDANPEVLVTTLDGVLADAEVMRQMGKKFHAFAKPHAAADMAGMIIGAAKKA
ncbi:MAG: UDP-N-acetylglucosamine--N-acetylmuramyl-(pentapeptide) pyrophosphoryl-undecaprenol N-acetylglucosamine transferase [Candidatus Saccharimonadales bacterium]